MKNINKILIGSRFISELKEYLKIGQEPRQPDDIGVIEKTAALLDMRVAQAPVATNPETSLDSQEKAILASLKRDQVNIFKEAKEVSKNVATPLIDIAKKLKEKGWGEKTIIALESFEDNAGKKIVRLFVNGEKLEAEAATYKEAFATVLVRVDNYEHSKTAKYYTDRARNNKPSEPDQYETRFRYIYDGLLSFEPDSELAKIISKPAVAAALTRRVMTQDSEFERRGLEANAATAIAINIHQVPGNSELKVKVVLKMTTKENGQEYYLGISSSIEMGRENKIYDWNMANSFDIELKEYYQQNLNRTDKDKKDFEAKVAAIESKLSIDPKVFSEAEALKNPYNIALLANELASSGYTENDLVRVRLKKSPSTQQVYTEISVNYAENASIGRENEALYRRPLPNNADSKFSYDRANFTVQNTYTTPLPKNLNQNSFEAALNNLQDNQKPDKEIFDGSSNTWIANLELAKYEQNLSGKIEKWKKLEDLLDDKANYQGLFSEVYENLSKPELFKQIIGLLELKNITPEQLKMDSLTFNAERVKKQGKDIVIISMLIDGDKYFYGKFNESDMQTTFTEIVTENILIIKHTLFRGNHGKQSDFERWKSKIK